MNWRVLLARPDVRTPDPALLARITDAREVATTVDATRGRTVHEIVAVLAELDLLLHRDPGAVARRHEILATKTELLQRIRAEQDQP